ncbi:hypothetical protein SEA_BEARBQ_84 [Gordonia phage BearBQ]|nr:hypothetical protein SEA_BEARBQ_84 [Gordonia phage BearBQ]
MSVPSLESLLAQHRPDLAIGTKKRVYCTCNEWGAFVETVQQADREHAAHVAEVIRQQWLTAEYIAAGTEGPDMDWTSEETWATPADAEEWHRRTQNQGWVERRFVSEWARVADGAEDHQ